MSTVTPASVTLAHLAERVRGIGLPDPISEDVRARLLDMLSDPGLGDIELTLADACAGFVMLGEMEPFIDPLFDRHRPACALLGSLGEHTDGEPRRLARVLIRFAWTCIFTGDQHDGRRRANCILAMVDACQLLLSIGMESAA